MKFNEELSKKSYNRYTSLEKEFIEIHGDKFDYSKTVYNGLKKKCNIVCKIHGNFQTTPQKHLNGQGCPICTQITKYGHLEVSKKNLDNYRDILIKYLSETYTNFTFDSLEINDKITFECKKHGKITSKKIICKDCNEDEKNLKKINTIKKLLKNRKEKVVSLEYDNVVLKCEHDEISYNNKQLYGNVTLCKKCNRSSNGITQDEFIERAINRVGDIYNIRNTTYINAKTKIPLVCNIHGKFEISPSNFFKGQGCSKCTHRTSKAEEEILKLVPGAKQSDRTLIYPKELDILSKTFAIEYNGLMWHSNGKSQFNKFNTTVINKNRHLEKTELVESKGLQLFHIFENEWKNKQDIWKSIINSKINKTKRIFARKCLVKEVSSLDAKNFENKNHLQGAGISSIRLGLYYNDELVSLMTFGKSRFDKNVEYELIRFCSKLNTTVVGGGGKLLKYFERNYNPKSIISYANRRWSQGNLYEQLGFKFVDNTPPNYFYFKPNENILYSRNRFQKHKLKKLLPVFNADMTETDNMFNNGYRKIYDCGNKKYLKIYT